MKSMKRNYAFTLVEILIVVCILGIVAAIVAPHYSNATTKAKEAAAKEILQMLQTTIERYATNNNGVPPGHPLNDDTYMASGALFIIHLEKGYLSKMPVNPFNKLDTVKTIHQINPMPEAADDTSGWIYQSSTKTIRLNNQGNDTEGIAYYNY